MAVERAGATRFEFGVFVFEPQRRTLSRAGRPVPLGARATDLLHVLLEQAGEIVPHDRLVQRVWPHTVVEPSSLRAQVTALRRALGDTPGEPGCIATAPGRGYGFVGLRVRATTTSPAVGTAPHNLPRPPETMIGREAEIHELAALVPAHRLVTLVGAGGIGKTTVALAAARALLPDFAGGVRLLDLSPVERPESLLASLAVALDLLSPGDASWPLLRAQLQQRRLLLVIDNCEHLADAVQPLVADLLEAVPQLHLLATSRMPLGVAGEHVLPLGPLATGDDGFDPHDPPPAVALFIDRARAVAGGFAPDAETTRAVQRVCRQLDGLPLALELAAVRVAALGVSGLADQLDGVLGLAAWGRRGGPTRHRTLQALIDWSYTLLDAREQAVLRRLSVFRGAFSREAAIALAAGGTIDAGSAAQGVQRLLARSLLVAAAPGGTDLRLLFVTRTYAQDQLEAAGEYAAWAQRHAAHVTDRLRVAADEICALPAQELPAWHRRNAGLLDELRAAADRMFGPGGHRATGIALLAAARHTVLEFGLFAEFMPRMRQALQALVELPAPDPALELRLCIAAMFVGLVAGLSDAERERLDQRIGTLQGHAATREQHVDALYALACNAWSHGAYHRLGALATELRRHVPARADEPAWVLLGERLHATASFYDGRLTESCRRFRRVLAFPSERLFRQYIGHTPREVQVGLFLARACWILGRSDDADRVVDQGLARVDELMPMALSNLLGHAAVPLALWQGRLALAAERLDRLAAHTEQHRQGYWQPLIDGYRHALALRQGAVGMPPLLPRPPHPLAADLFATLAPAMVTATTLERARSGRIGWCAAEVLRAEAVRRLAHDPEDAAAREDLATAARLAREQGALAWELRIACTQARLAPDTTARERVAACLARVRQGRDTTDVREAQALLQALAGAGSTQATSRHEALSAEHGA